MNLDQLIIKSSGAKKEIIDDEKNCSDYRFKNKKIYDKYVLFNGTDLSNVTLIGRGSLSLSSKFSQNNHFSLCLSTNTDIENITPRPASSLKFSFNHLNLNKYNRMSALVYIEATGYQSFYFHFLFGNDGFCTNHAPILLPNQWNYITWECDHIRRDDIQSITITPFLMGCPPEALPNINIYIDNISSELVDKEFDEGWELADRIAYCHSGYLPVSKKIAITCVCENEYFNIVNTETNKITKYKVKQVESNLGTFYTLDFSNITENGLYYLEVDNRKTEVFPINFVCFDTSIWKSLNFLRSLRCGEEVEGVHSACHLNCRSIHPNGQTVPNFGGWHDAGDVSQFEICTAEMAHALLDLAYTLRSEALSIRLLDEAKVGLNWLLRTRFNDGYRTLGVTYNIWRKNVLDSNNNSIITKAEAGSFENFLASAAEAAGYKMFKENDSIYANYLLRTAIDDFKFACYEYDNKIYTVRWGKPIESQTAGTAILACCELYNATLDSFYLEKGLVFANIVMACQEKGSENIPFKGFFYEDQEHKYILAYEHRGHEQSPIQGLARLYSLLPQSQNKDLIKKSLELYKSYILDTIKYTKPYNLLPGHLYHVDKINIKHFTIPPKMEHDVALNTLLDQIKEGIDFGNGWYLRIMPIAISRRGFHATLLSKTKAVSTLYKVLGDSELKNIVTSQIEWILGKNPFASSTMYGEGHNYHPLYVAFSRQIVGALPVGIKTKDKADLPYWPTVCNAVFKEIWGHTTGKYLWVLADIL